MYFSTALWATARRGEAACTVQASHLDAAPKGIAEVLFELRSSQNITAKLHRLLIVADHSLRKIQH